MNSGINGGVWGGLIAATFITFITGIANQIRAALGLSYILGSSGTTSAVSSGTVETQLGSVAVPAGAMGANGALRITAWWTYTNSGNNKTLRIRLGGAAGTIFWATVPTTTANSQTQITIRNNNSASAQKVFLAGATSPYSASATAPTTGAIDTSLATSVYISGQTASGGETITLESYTVELIPGVPTP